ncbi:gas-vesicle operon protein gvpH [Haloferax mediterranei ATCC 33500]|uniref:Gas-vesicle operon protein gvpH n=1 Tax=Haloferax mediterranei (strain ATCC 33500 / DSM 1411 / JCM 8866 / NBRC 14739 / NCIMB 2177 / R-4) TaxID=523841 RepID=M0J8S2_HALMT|nr:gas-vesicle operon protein gvpH [Haloferax mediterranei ATCC 33500]
MLDQLRAILETLAEIEEDGHRQGHGRIDRGNAQIDYDYEVSFGLGPRSRRGKPSDEPRVEAPRTEGTDSQPEGEKSIHIETRETDDGERVVIADLPGVADDELDVTLDADESALELRTDEGIVGRVPLDQPDVEITDVRLRNQVLEIRLTRTNESNGSESK